MDWRSAILDNWGYKLAALLIVFLLWVSLTADERLAEQVTAGIRYDVRDAEWALVEAPREAEAAFRGRSWELRALVVGDEPEVRVTVDSVTGPVMQVPLDTEDLAWNRELDVRPVGLSPSSVELRFERRAERRLPVHADVEARPALGYTILRPLPIEPDSVTVFGPTSAVEGLDRVSTRRIHEEDLESTALRDVPLEPPAPGVEVEPASVLVTIPVDSLVVRTVRLPVRAVGVGVGTVTVSPDSVTATVQGAHDAVRRQLEVLEAAEARATRPPAEPTGVPLEVDLVSGGHVSVTLRPAEVTLAPRAGGS